MWPVIHKKWFCLVAEICGKFTFVHWGTGQGSHSPTVYKRDDIAMMEPRAENRDKVKNYTYISQIWYMARKTASLVILPHISKDTGIWYIAMWILAIALPQSCTKPSIWSYSGVFGILKEKNAFGSGVATTKSTLRIIWPRHYALINIICIIMSHLWYYKRHCQIV